MSAKRSTSANESELRLLCEYFDEDVVYRIVNGNVELGVVVESCENASSDEDDDDDDDKDDDDNESDDEKSSSTSWKRIKPGFTKVAWYPRGRSEIVAEKKLKLFDRSLLPGDIVRNLVKGMKGDQRGYCKDTVVYATVKIIGTNSVISKVDCSKLIQLSPLRSDIVCLFDSWIGYINDIKYNVTLKCCDGSVLVVSDDDLLDFDDILDTRDVDSTDFESEYHYVGQHLCGPKKLLRGANWLHQTKEMRSFIESGFRRPSSKIKVTVTDVQISSVSVNWLCSISSATVGQNNFKNFNFSDSNNMINDQNLDCNHEQVDCSAIKEMHNYALDSNYEPPSDVITGDDVNRMRGLDYFQRCSMQIGDHAYYVIEEGDNVISLNEWKTRRIESESMHDFSLAKNHASVNDNLLTDKQNVNDNSQVMDIVNGESGNFQPMEVADGDIIASDDDDDDSQFEDMSDDEILNSCGDSISATRSLHSPVPNESKCSHKHKNITTAIGIKQIKKKKLKVSKRRNQCNTPIKLSCGSKVAVEILATETVITVAWQDGKIEDGLPSTSLYPVHHLDGHDFFPGDFVVENKEEVDFHQYGIVQHVNQSARTATVNWIRAPPTLSDTHLPQVIAQEDVSVYDIKDHSDFHYRPGCCVIKIPATENVANPDPLSRAGQVIDLSPSGQLLCAWLDGSKSYVFPQELYIIGEYDSDDLWDDSIFDFENNTDSDSSSISTDSWETESEHSTIASNCNLTPKATNARNNAEGQMKTNKSTTTPSQPKTPRTNPTDLVELLRNAVTQLEEFLTQNPSSSYRNGLLTMQKIFKMCRHLKLVDQQLGTSLIKLKDLQNLIESAKPPLGSTSSSKIPLIVGRLAKLLSSSNADDPNKRRNRSSTSSPERGSQNFDDDDDLVEELGASNVNEVFDSPSTAVHQPGRNTVCLELLRKLKSHLFSICANFESLNKSVSQFADMDNSCDMQSEDNANASSSGICDSLEMQIDNIASESETNNKGDEMLKGLFSFSEFVADSHRFKLSLLQPNDPKEFNKRVRNEITLLRGSLPKGIIVKGFEDRMDLYSVMIIGPKGTPYEDGIFLFDVQFPAAYPNVPPYVHYISYCSDRLNPNLYESGKVCVSLLGTWSGKGSECWSPATSSILQVIISIQGLILVPEPYYNEAGYLKQRGTTEAHENSRLYNEMAVLKIVQSMTKLLLSPCETFKSEIFEHVKKSANRFIARLEYWLVLSEKWNSTNSTNQPSDINDIAKFSTSNEFSLPDFPLLPGSQGFCLTLRKALSTLKEVLFSLNIECT